MDNVENLTVLLEASLHFTTAEAMREARRIIDCARAEGYRQGYTDGQKAGPDHSTSPELLDCE